MTDEDYGEGRGLAYAIDVVVGRLHETEKERRSAKRRGQDVDENGERSLLMAALDGQEMALIDVLYDLAPEHTLVQPDFEMVSTGTMEEK
jgi:hypothetical protein